LKIKTVFKILAAIIIIGLVIAALRQAYIKSTCDPVTMYWYAGIASATPREKTVWIPKDDLSRVEEIDKKYTPVHAGDEAYKNSSGVRHYYTDDEINAVSVDEARADYEEMKKLLGIDGKYESEGAAWDSYYTDNVKTFVLVREGY